MLGPQIWAEVVSDSSNRYTISVFLISRGVWTHHPHRLLHPQFFPSFATRRVGDDIHAAGTPPVPAPACPPGPARRSGSEFAPSPRAPVPRLVRATDGVPTLPAFECLPVTTHLYSLEHCLLLQANIGSYWCSSFIVH